MKTRLSLFLLFCALVTSASSAAEQIYFKNRRVVEAASHEVKGILLFVTLTSGATVIMDATEVDWEETTRLNGGGVVLRRAPSAQEMAEEEASLMLSRKVLTAADLKVTRGASRRIRRGADKSSTFQVYASRGWTDSGIDVAPGLVVRIRASGRVSVRSDLSVGPQGHESTGGSSSTPILTAAAFGAVIGKIGGSGQPFLVSQSLTLTPEESGRLYLAANDENLADNSGSFTIELSLPSAKRRATRASGSSWSGGYSGGLTAPAGSTGSNEPAQPMRKGQGRAIDKARAATGQHGGR